MDTSVPEVMSEATRLRWQAKRQRQDARYLRGPVPLEWLGKASTLPGKALAVALMVWYWRGLTGETTVKICPESLPAFKLSRFAVQRGLQALESAGLITVQRHRGRCPVVTLTAIDVKPYHKKT